MPTKTKVVVTKSKLDTLADTIATKAVITLPETIDNLTTAVASIKLYEEPNLQDKSVNPAQVSQTVTADSGYDGLGTVTVGPLPYDLSQDTVNPAVLLEGYTAHDATGTPIVGTYSGDSAVISVTEELDENGGIIKHINAIDISHDTVDAAHLLQGYTAHDRQGNAITGTYTDSSIPTSQTKTATPSESVQTITADSGYDALSSVEIAAIPSNYVGSAIDQNDSSDLTVSGATVSVPAGYYAEDASKSVASGTAVTPDTSITANPSISVSSSGLITATASASESVTPTVSAGYVSTGTSGTITVSGSNTSQLTTQAATTITPTKSSQTAVAAGRYTTGAVTVAAIPADYIIPEGSTTITQNGTVDVTEFASAIINVPTGSTINNQNKTVTPSESSQSITADTGYTGLGTVTVNAIDSTYVGSGIDRRDDTDLTVSGATVTVPAGYYVDEETKSVATTTHPDPSVSINSSGLITATHTQGTGYVTGGTTTKTQQLTTQAATTITPTKSSQTAVASGVYTTGAITVAAIPSNYIDTSDATASAADINSGETAYVNGVLVTGTQVIQHYYTGSSAPSSSLGSNGDIYLQA